MSVRGKAPLILVAAMMTLAALVFTVQAAKQFYQFWQLDAVAPIKALAISPKALAHDHYVLFARFRYLDRDGTQTLDNKSYKNLYAAEDAAQARMITYRNVWYNSNNPAQASLDKEISYKLIIYTLILWGLTAYFFLLNKYLRVN